MLKIQINKNRPLLKKTKNRTIIRSLSRNLKRKKKKTRAKRSNNQMRNLKALFKKNRQSRRLGLWNKRKSTPHLKASRTSKE
jgi:hypothetical protein